jgi:hypothetical protein
MLKLQLLLSSPSIHVAIFPPPVVVRIVLAPPGPSGTSELEQERKKINTNRRLFIKIVM